ncbi:MAG: hypothetical protein AAGI63_12000 [Planctomycetota bacterium]
MTVAPGWPQDGNDPTQASQDNVSEGVESKEVLPPTLFQLPSLRSELARKPQVAGSRDSTDASLRDQATDHIGTKDSALPQPAADKPQVSTPIHTIDPDVSPKAENTRPVEPIDQPVGTTQFTAESSDFSTPFDQDHETTVERVELTLPRDESASVFENQATDNDTLANESLRNPFSIPAPPAPPEPAVNPNEDLDRANEQSLRTKPTDDPITKRIPPRPIPDAPAGRSWSESIGSHGIVLGLLLVVVAAALITGRDGQENDTESNLAGHSDLIEFDRGDMVEMPDVTADSMMMPEYREQIVAGNQSSDGETDPSVSSMSSEDLVNVTLDAPDYESMPGTMQGSFGESGFPGASVEAQTASSRKPDLGSALEDLLEPLPQGSRPRLSTTPYPLQNLLDYMPPKPESSPTPSLDAGR